MANAFLNAQEYANVMLLLLKNQIVTGKLVDTRYTNQVTDENGLTISVKRPPQFIDKKSGTSAALALQDIVVGKVDIAVNQYSKVHIGIGDIEYVQSYNELMRNETMKSAASTLAHSVDAFLQDKLLGFNSWVGTPGSDIASPAQFNPVHTRLMANGVPNSDLNATVDFVDGEKIRGAMTGLFLPPDMNRSALEKVRIPILSEIDLYATQQGPVLTTGTRASSGAGAINGANQNVNYRDVKNTLTQTIAIDGLAAGATIKAGEVFTIANVFAYDPRRGQTLPFLQQFTVTADATASGGGAIAALSISPAIIVPGTNDGVSTDTNTAFANVNSAPADNALLTFSGAASTSYKIRAAFHKQAIAMVSAKLQAPFTGVYSFARDPVTGISIRYWRGSDISTGQHIHRWDMIYGASNMDPRLGARINGT